MTSRGLADMVSLGRKVSSQWALDKVDTFMAELVPLLPTCDAANRVAKNYAMILMCSSAVSIKYIYINNNNYRCDKSDTSYVRRIHVL